MNTRRRLFMKERIIKKILVFVIVLCMIFNLVPMLMNGFMIEAKAVSGIDSLTCAGFISDTTRRNYIDVMMKHYLNTNSKLTQTLDDGYSVVFMFEGGSDNYTNTPYQDAVGTVRTQAVVIVVKKNSSGNAYIDYYNESCSSIPDDANWTSGGAYDNSTTVFDGIYRMITWNHTGPYAALQLSDATTSWYTPTPGQTGGPNYCSGINVHTRRSNYTGGRSANYAQSAGCQLISYGENSSNGFNEFMKSVTGITWNPWEYPTFNTFASTGAFKGYYVLDRQLGLVSPSGVEYGSGSLATLYTTGDLNALTQFSTNARANASFSYLDKCTEYPSYCNIEVTLDGAPINSLPCSSGTDKSTTLESAVKGDKYVATGLYKNLYGNYWYKIQTKSGGTGYIYGGEVKYLSQMTPDVTLQNATAPNGHPTGTAFYLNGTVKTTYNQITKVEAAVYRGFGTTGEKTIGGSETITTKSYKIEGSKVDNDTWFNKIEPGKYTYVIYASYENYYADGATTLKSNTGTLTLMSEYFITVASSINQSTCNHSYENTVLKAATCTTGGSSVKSCSKCGVLSKITDTKLGHKAGTAVKENEVPGVSYDLVSYCIRCTTEMGRETIKQDTSDVDKESGESTDNGNTRIVLTDSFLTSKIKNYTYTGKALTQNIVLKNGKYTLVKNVDYTVKYLNNINAGTAQVIVTGIGNYSGCIIKEYKVSKVNISKANVTLSKNEYTYNGEYIKPIATVTATVNGKKTKLTNKIDYKVSFKNFKMPGIATITITGKGNYSGTLAATYVIKPNLINKVSQKVSSTYTKNLRITWSEVVGVTGYEIYKSTEKSGTYTKVGTVTGKEFISRGLQPGTSYYYKVRAYKTVDGKKVYGDYSNAYKATTRTVPPSKIMKDIASNKVNISWNYSKGAKGYEVYMSTNKKYIGSKVATTIPTERNINLINLNKGKTYYVRVRAYTITSAGVKMYSKFTPYVSFTVK